MDSLNNRLGGHLSRRHGQVVAFAVQGVEQHRRVSGDEIAIAIKFGNGVVATLGQPVRGILLRLAAGYEGRYHRVLLEGLHQLIGFDLGVAEIGQISSDEQGERTGLV